MNYFKESAQSLEGQLYWASRMSSAPEGNKEVRLEIIEKHLKRVGIDTAMDTVLQAECGWDISNETLGLPHHNKGL